MEAVKKFLEHILMAINAIIMILGIALICFAGYTLTKSNNYHEFLDKGFFSVPGFVIFVGTALTLIFFLGCCGILRKSRWMTITFSVIMTVLLLMCIVCGAAAFMLRSEINGNLQKTMNESLSDYKTVNSTSRGFWDGLQETIPCCGVNGSADYPTLLNMTVPQSCCNKDTHPDFKCNTADPLQINTKGCYPIIKEEMEVVKTIFNLSMGVAFFELLVVIGHCYLGRRYGNEYESV